MAKIKQDSPRILLYDIEASNLNANWGFTFCVGYKWYGEAGKARVLTNRQFGEAFKKDPTDDRPLLEATGDLFSKADIIVGHYSKGFDYPFLQTRRLIHDMDPLPVIPHVDTWHIARYKLKLNSNRLDTVSRIIPVDSKLRKEKTAIDPLIWNRAIAGDIKALKYIEHHCLMDIEVLEQVYEAIRPFASNLPNASKLFDSTRQGCPSCNASNTNRRGYRVTPHGRYRQYQCMECGHWFKGKDLVKKVPV